MIFRPKKKEMVIKKKLNFDNGQEIEEVKYSKFIGLFLDKELSWKYHINQITMKISKLTGIISETRHFLPLKSFQNIHYTMMYPYLIYFNHK